MTTGGPSHWPVVLFLGVCVSLLVGSAVALAAPSSSGRPWWHEDEPVRVTGAVLAVDAGDRGDDGHRVTLDGLVTYHPEVRAGIGTLTVEVPASVDALAGVRAGDTVDMVLTRHDGEWIAEAVELLETD
jgi:hypothetical protein